jgi:hypothetical protein
MPMSQEPDMSNAVDISGFANTTIIVITFVVLGAVLLIPRMIATPQKPAQSEA